jgi:hypothetical protein
MHHERHHGPGRFGRRRQLMRPFPSREELIERLEQFHRDLEQELANLDDVLRHLKGNPQQDQHE